MLALASKPDALEDPRTMSLRFPALLLLTTMVALPVGEAAARPHCRPASPACPLAVHLVRGGPARVVHGTVRRPSDRFSYVFRAQAGATLLSRFRGPAARLVITDPAGEADGPGFPATLPLHRTGRYRIEVSPNTMAEGIFGRFALTLRLR